MAKITRRQLLALISVGSVGTIAGAMIRWKLWQPHSDVGNPNRALSTIRQSQINFVDQPSATLVDHDWNFYNKHASQSDTHVYIHAVDITLPGTEFLDDKYVTVYADTVRIVGTLHCLGAYIFARQVIGQEGSSSHNASACIDVSGAKGSPDHKVDDHPLPAQGASERGKDGAKGGDGQNGGDVQIIAEDILGRLDIMANGGRGGRGQNGGAGGPGKDGTDGQDATGGMGQVYRFWGSHEYHTNDRPVVEGECFEGEPGGRTTHPGGGGKGGVGGNGGQAGNVSISTCNKIVRFPPEAELTPGLYMGLTTTHRGLFIESQGGKGGAPGEVAHLYTNPQPGKGGKNWFSGDWHGRDGYICGQNAANRGFEPYAPGELDVYLPKNYAKAGKTQSDSITSVNQFDYNQTGELADISFCLMLLHKVQLDYFSENYEACYPRLIWLVKLTSTASGTKVPPLGHTGYPSPGYMPGSEEEWISIHNQARALLSQLYAGLDFFGHPQNYVPRIAYSSYKEVIKSLIDLGTLIEAQYNTYRQHQDAAQIQLGDLRIAISQSKTLIVHLEDEGAQIQVEISSLAKDIVAMRDQAFAYEKLLYNADLTFQEAVNNQNNQSSCSFGNTLKAVFSVMTVPASLSSGFGAVSNLVNLSEGKLDAQFQQSLEADHSDKPLLLRKVEVAGQDFEGISKAWGKISGQVPDRADNAKILVSQENFEKTLKPYLDLPQAQKYKDLMRSYVELVTTRNSKIADYTSKQKRIDVMNADILQNKEQIKRMQNIGETLVDPGLVETKVFLGRLYTGAKTNLVQLLYQERRAWEYWALRRHDFSVSDQDIAGLAALHGIFINDELSIKNSRNRSDQPLDNITVNVSDGSEMTEGVPPATRLPHAIVMHDAFNNFRDPLSLDFGRISFFVPIDYPSINLGFAGVTVKQVNIEIPGLKTDAAQLKISLLHSGKALFRDTQGNKIEFQHNSVDTEIVYKLKSTGLSTPINNNLIGTNNEYAYLSPFTVWTLFINPSFHPALNLTEVSHISLTFSGFFLS